MKKTFGIFFLLFSLALVSCEEDEYVNQDIDTDPIPVDTTDIDPGDTTACSGNFFLMGPPLNPADSMMYAYADFASTSASVFMSSCSELPEAYSNTNHIVIYSNNFNWGANGVQVGFSANGFPGIEISADVPFEVGPTYYLLGSVYSFPSMLEVPAGGAVQLYELSNVYVNFTEVGDEVGESISGTITGVIEATDGTMITATGQFCSPIADICN